MFQPLFWHVLHPITWLYTQTDNFPWFYSSFWAQEQCLGTITASPYSWFLNQAFINFRSGILELCSITCFGNLQPPLYFYTCNSPISMWFTKFFLICLYNMFSTFLFYHFPSSPPSPVHVWSFLSVFLTCFIQKICSLVSFLIALLGYLISTKDLCRYSRNTEENCFSFILCEVSLSLIAILNLLLICNLIPSPIPCDPTLF